AGNGLLPSLWTDRHRHSPPRRNHPAAPGPGAAALRRHLAAAGPAGPHPPAGARPRLPAAGARGKPGARLQPGRPGRGHLRRPPLGGGGRRCGGTLLVRVPRVRIRRLGPDADFLLLEPVENPAPDYSGAGRAAAIFGGAIGLAAAGVLHVSLAAALGAVAMVVGGCLRIEEAHRAIDWRTIIAIGGMLPLGTALETTGAATLLAEWLARLGADAGPGAGAAAVLPAGLPAARPLAACALIGAMTIALTQILTN